MPTTGPQRAPSRRRSCLRLLASAAIAATFPTAAGAQSAPPAGAPAPATPTASAVAAVASTPAKLNTTDHDIDLVVPLHERVPIGQVTVRITPADEVLVSKAELSAALKRGVTATFLAGIEQIPDIGGFIPLDALPSHGLTLKFDKGSLDLTATFDPTAFNRESVKLGFGGPPAAVRPDTSALVSAFLSYEGSVDWVQKGTDQGLRKPRVNFDFDGRLFHLISFENQFTYDGNLSPSFTRFASRAIYDIPQSSLRIAAGDLLPDPLPLQDQVDVGGIGIAKLLDEFHPDRLYSATTGQRLLLREPATVTVVVNGVPSRTIRLDAGSYNLQDLPLTGGANRVDLVIEDDAGGRRVVSFDFFQDVSLLAPGVDEYDFNAGVRSDSDLSGRHYFGHEPVFTGFYRRGISTQLTLGANAQASRDAVQVGGEATWGSPIGLFTLEGAGSDIKDFGAGAAVRLQYRFSTPLQQLAGERRFDVLAEFHTRDFGGIDGSLPSNPFVASLTARYFQPFTPRLGAGVGVDYRKGRDGIPNQYSINANATYRLPNGMNLTGSVGYEQPDGFIFGATLFWQIGRGSTVAARYDSRLQEADVSYYHSPKQLLDTIAWGVDASHSEDGAFGVNATGIWRTNRGDLELDHRSIFGGNSGESEEVSSLRARGTIAFADGSFATGRYLTNSFAIVSPHESLNGADVLIGSNISSRAEARTGTFGAALAQLSSYSQQNVYFNVPDAPLGYDFGTGNLEFYPWLHSGFHRVIGSEFNVTMTGTLLDDKGQPLALIVGHAHRVGDPKSPDIEVYTNREGRLGASGFAPGTWAIDAGGFNYRLVITKAEGALVNAHELRPLNSGDVK